MAIIGRNLVPTPQFHVTQNRGAWETGNISAGATAGLDGTAGTRLIGSASIPVLSCPILGERFIPGHGYMLTIRMLHSSDTEVVAYLGPEGASGGWNQNYQGRSHTFNPGRGDNTWQTLTTTLVLEDVEFEDQLGNPIPAVNSPLFLYVSTRPSGQGTRMQISHVRLDHIENTYGTAYFDGASTPDHPDVVHSWTGSPFLSSSVAVGADPDPEPTDPEPTDPEPTDPEPTDPEPTDPEPEPDDADPWDVYEVIAERLAPRAAAFTGRGQDAVTIATARAQLPVVIEYVRGYTRGKGFSEAGLPASPLRAVIVSAVARLVVNPEQLTYYSVGDYSERPAVLSGWTLAELAVLRRYRRTAA